MHFYFFLLFTKLWWDPSYVLFEPYITGLQITFTQLISATTPITIMNTTCLHKSEYWDTCFDELWIVVILFQIIIQSSVLLLLTYTIFKIVYTIIDRVLWKIDRINKNKKWKKQNELSNSNNKVEEMTIKDVA